MLPPARERRHVLTAAIVGTGLVLAYAAFAMVQLLWLNPLAAVPGASLEQIHRELAAAGESMATPYVIGLLSLGPIAAVVVLVRAVSRPETGLTFVRLFYLWLLTLGTPAYFWASFGPAMAMADTYFISGGDHAPWALILYAVSAVALLALLAFMVVAVLRQRSRIRARLSPPPSHLDAG